MKADRKLKAVSFLEDGGKFKSRSKLLPKSKVNTYASFINVTSYEKM